MDNLWSFIENHFHWLLFIILEAVSVVMIFSYNSYQGSVWVSSANAFAGKVYEWQSGVEHFFSLTDQNAILTQRNIALEQELDYLRQQLIDKEVADNGTKGYTSGMDSVMRELHLIPAKVIANSVTNSENLITIDKGSSDGIRPDMGVICGSGVVGVVYLTSSHYSVVIPALNKRSRISCSIRGRDYFGYLTWTGGDPTKAYVEDMPRHAKFKRGDWVETSGYSSIFPHGVAVGKIEKIFNSKDGLSYRLQIGLSTDFARLRDVCVINDSTMVERMRLNEATNDSLMLMPIKE